MNIIRLSFAKIRSNIKESVLLGILIAICVTLLSAAASSLAGIKRITPDMVRQSGCYENQVLIDQRIYTDRFLTFLEEDDRLERFSYAPILVEQVVKIKTERAERDIALSFVTTGSEMKLEIFDKETSLSPEEEAAVEHPIYLNSSLRKVLAAGEGERLTIDCGDREYEFTLAGFYNSGIGLIGSKAVISEEDYLRMEEHSERYEAIGITLKDGQDNRQFMKEFKAFCREVSQDDISEGFYCYAYEELESTNNINMSILSIIMIVMAGITVVAIMVMIRFRIVGDIRDQIVSIGVLEALGYTSGQIASSYVIEYFLIAAAGALAGIVPAMFLAGFLLDNASLSVGYGGSAHVGAVPFLIALSAVVIFVVINAFSKSLSVRKYPPVRAFRKGIETHHHRREILPLDKTYRSVHLRLALRGFFDNLGQNAGLILCIMTATTAVVLSFMIADFLSTPDKILESVSGHELGDIEITTIGVTDPEAFGRELGQMPGVDRVLRTSSGVGMQPEGSETYLKMDIFDDFSVTRTIVLTEGRLPQHDNEIALTTQGGTMISASVGDTVVLEYNKVRKDYVVTGLVNSIVNPNTGYMTTAGFKRVNPVYEPDSFMIFLEEGTDPKEFAEILTGRYGRDIADISGDEVTGDTLEERIVSAANIKMAKAMLKEGVSYMEYAVRIGDKTITGGTNLMKINSLEYIRSDYEEIIEQACIAFKLISALLMAVSAVVVMIILSILMESTIRKQHRELGIMKGMGYTSKELMYQMAMRIVPAAVIATALGTVISIAMSGLVEGLVAKITFSPVKVLAVDVLILLFCFFAAYIAAKKIKNISVYELMTE